MTLYIAQKLPGTDIKIYRQPNGNWVVKSMRDQLAEKFESQQALQAKLRQIQ
jgi:hypothetical protein